MNVKIVAWKHFLIFAIHDLVLCFSDDALNHSSGPISRTDEQSLLSRILHQTAQYVIFLVRVLN